MSTQAMFLSRNKKIINIPVNPSFTVGSKLYRYVFVMGTH